MSDTNQKHTDIAVTYNLPTNWEQEKAFSFEHLTGLITEINDTAYTATVKAINRFATVRNYVMGLYIVEYEQHGSDRAKYGDRLLKRLAESVNKKGINETLLQVCRRFYMAYPQIQTYLEGKNAKSEIYATASHKLEKSPTATDELEKSATASHKFITPADRLISNLSFSHIREILTADDPLERFFYETECMRCCWSVKELRRQMSTNLYFRAGVSEKPELLIARTQKNAEPQLSINNPFSFEFLGLRPEAFTENDLENALISHLQDFILELGKGFCFEARQKRMLIDDEYYFADLVFYNRVLHCNVIVELKDDEFNHADLSQLNAYVSYFRENEMNEGDNPPVGILLCTRKGKQMVEYALAGMDNKLFVSTYMLALPDKEALENFILRETAQR